MTANVPVLSREQQEIFEGRSKAWQAKANKALATFRGLVRTNVLTRYDLGELVRDLAGDEVKYGTGAVPALAAVLGESATTLWNCRVLAQTYTRPQLDTLLERGSKAGYQFTWSHLRLLISLDDPKRRRELETLTIEKRLTAADIQAKIQQTLGGKRKDTGRKPVPPKSPAAALGQIAKLATDILNRSAGWEEQAFTHFDNAGEDQISPDDLHNLEAVHAQLVSGRMQLQQLEAHSSKTVEKLRQRLSKAPATNGAVTPSKRQRPDTERILNSDTARPAKPAAKKKAKKPAGKPAKAKA